MDINHILQQIDTYYEENRGEEAERFMRECIERAVAESEDGVLLQLLNELLGYYRETSQVENSYHVARQVIALAERMGLQGSLQYATTLLNVANAYRAGGKLTESLDCYRKVREIYNKTMDSKNLLVASLENNISLLYQEMGEYGKAKESLLRALDIVKAKNADFEVAVTYANMASTCLLLREPEEAYVYAGQAIETFEALGVTDFHYGAALSALGSYYYGKEEYQSAKSYFVKARDIMEQALGKNEYYHRLTENIAACDSAFNNETTKDEIVEQSHQKHGEQIADEEQGKHGLELCREYYETYGRPMIAEKFPAYESRIAVGLVGEGSDCFGFDDAISGDHDWGPDFCMWVTEETYQEIGADLQEAYEQLPKEFQGYQRTVSIQGKGRRGVMTISAFYGRLLQTFDKEETDSKRIDEGIFEWERIDWRQVSDAALSAAVNGEVFRDEEGIFSEIRRKLQKGYPENILYLKLAESAARFAQAGQYNYARMCRRKDCVTAQMMLADAVKEAMKLKHYLEGKYPPHDKWLHRSMEKLPGGENLSGLLQRLYLQDSMESFGMQSGNDVKAENWCNVVKTIEQIATLLVKELYEKNFISDIDPYLDAHTGELLCKAGLAVFSDEELAEKIAELEFEAFDKVENVGGRADCQNDWATFSIMRKSQYLTWNRTMLLQYYYDFQREYHRGHNLITEKYGRMMESTAPDEYERIKNQFPILSPEKKAIIEEIVRLQVEWMDAFAEKYPQLADNARSIHSEEDHLYNTSYETYLRGEISTYSDKMLELYGRYVVEYARQGKNLAVDIMTNNVHMYGYRDLDAAEKFLGL